LLLQLVEQANSENDINPHLRNRIQVLHGKVEDPKIQEMALSLGRVDTIISEPIGVMLFHERMVRMKLPLLE
jgi:histone-arginine methyltransferase CARM1